MLTPDEEKYLLTIPKDKKVVFYPYDLKIPSIVEEIIQKIRSVEPTLEIRHMGASALGISGQGDLDIYVFSPVKDFDKHAKNLIKIFGEPVLRGTCVKWSFNKEGHDVELYLTDPNDPGLQRQIKVFEILKNNPDLLKEYEQIKKDASGLSFREYQRKKYEFYNRILSTV